MLTYKKVAGLLHFNRTKTKTSFVIKNHLNVFLCQYRYPAGLYPFGCNGIVFLTDNTVEQLFQIISAFQAFVQPDHRFPVE